MKKAREMGMNQYILAGNGFNSPEYIKQAGEAADRTVVATPWNPERKTDKAQNFRKAYVAKYGHEPDQFAAQAYDAMYVLHQAVEQSGTTTDRKKFRDTLAKISDFEGATGKFAFDETVIRRWTSQSSKSRAASGYRWENNGRLFRYPLMSIHLG